MNHRYAFLISIVVFSFFSILFSLNIPVIWPDEVLFFNPAWELKNNGIMRTSVLNGLIPGMDTHTLWMPPLFMILLSGVFQIFPSELITARLFSSFISLGSIYLVYRICISMKFSTKRVINVLLLLATDFVFLKFSHTARMESLCLFFALAAFYFLLWKGFANQVLMKPSIFFSGICLSLSLLSHPFGIVHSIPILFLMFQRKSLNFRNITLYTFAGLIPLILWALYVIPNWEIFIVQFGAQLSRKNELLGKFTLVDKVKIIFSVFKFPIFKLGLFAITLIIVFYHLMNRLKENIISKFDSMERIRDSSSVFFLVWLFTILGFLFISSESWYVFQLVVPFTLLLSAVIEIEPFPLRGLLIISAIYNLAVIFWVPYSTYYIYKMPEKTEAFFNLIENSVLRKNYIYLQAIPDPYFHLRKKYPNKILSEFIPGELSALQSKNADGTEKEGLLKRLGIAKQDYKIDSSFYQHTIHKQEVFIFYNESLMNDYIRKYLTEESARFERKVIQVETPKGSELKLEAVIYLQK